MTHVPGRPVVITGYPDTWVANPGGSVAIHVDSANAAFRATLVRLTGDVVDGEPQTSRVCDLGNYPGTEQRTRPGSYVLVADAADAFCSVGVTVSVWVYPTQPGHGQPQTVISRMDQEIGIAVRLDGAGRLELVFAGPMGSRHLTCQRRLAAHTWYRVTGGIDGDRAETHLRYEDATGTTGELVSRHLDTSIARPNDSAPLLIGARLAGPDAEPCDYFDGKIEAPTLWRATSATGNASPTALIASWDFGVAPESTHIHDTGPNGLHGRAVNCPTRSVTGHAWDGAEVDPRHAPDAYRAAHFHADDLEDAGWRTTFDLTVPGDLASGVYAAELTSPDDRRWLPFVVTPRRPSNRIAVVLPTYTYLAYANFRITGRAAELAAQLRGLAEPELSPEEQYVLAHPQLGLSLYDSHADGSPNCYSTRLRPVIEMSPLYRYSSSGAPRHFPTDLALLGWLRRNGHSADVLTDQCLDTGGARLLEPYRVVLTGSHPEYCTAAMLDALSTYVSRGGRIMYLGGNGFYWVTSTSETRHHLIEVRRGHAGTRTIDSPPGETHHSLTGEQGGLWRHRGRPPQRLVGVGFCGLGYGSGAGYRQLPAARTSRFSYALDGVPTDALIGDSGPTGGAADDEVDHASPELGTPKGAVMLATSKGNHRHGYHRCIEDVRQLAPDVLHPDDVGADLVMTDWPGGGITLATGSIGWINCLPHDGDQNTVSTVTNNVLRGFLRIDRPEPGD